MSQEVIDLFKELSEHGVKETPNAEIEQIYNQLINEIGADSSTEKFSEEIKKLYRTFQVASANEKILLGLYKELKKAHIAELKKMNVLIELQKEERKEMDNLTRRLNEMTKLQQLTKEELRQKDSIIRSDVIFDKKDEPTVDNNMVEELEKDNERLKAEKAELIQNVDRVQRELQEALAQREKLHKALKELENQKNEVNQKLENQMMASKKELERKDIEIGTFRGISENHLKDKDKLAQDLKDLSEKFHMEQKTSDGLKKDIDEVNIENKRLNIDKESLMKKINQLNDDKKLVIQNEKTASDLVKQLEEEKEILMRKLQKEESMVKEKNRLIDKNDKKYNEKVLEIEKLKGELAIKENELEIKDKELDIEIQQKNNEIRYKAKIGEDLKKANEDLEKKELQIIEMGAVNKSNTDQLQKLKKQLYETDKICKDLEKQRDTVTEDNTKQKNKIDHLLEDIRLGENRTQELQKKVTEGEKKMKMQREVYDAVRKDKNLYFKNLIETQDDLVERQSLLQFNKKEIENLKSDLKKKDDYIVDIKAKNAKFEKLLKMKQLDNDKIKIESENLNKIVQTQKEEMEKLKNDVEETANNFKKLESEYKKTIIDRDNLSSQLIRRNDEVSLLHEKIMILTTDLSRSEQEFNATKEMINKYIRENRNLLRELEISKNYKEKADTYAKGLINLNKELLREKNLNKALTEEVESSEKLYHRWRKLEGIDPDSLEQQYKIGLLQKRLISKTEECVEKEITIQDLTRELANLKKLANKRPQFEIEESIKQYKQELSRQSEKMKAIIAELNMYRNKVEEFKTENNKIKKENTDLQMKYHEIKIRTNRQINQQREEQRQENP